MSIQDRNLKPGQVLVGRYHKKDHRCEVVKTKDGKVAFRVGGKEYGSPSAAGSAVMGGVSCNGWRFWTVEGAATRAVTTAKKGAPKAKATAKPKGKAKRTKARKVAGGANGADQPVEKPVNCDDCGQEFPTSRAAGDHMRDEHGSLEASGAGA